LDDSNTFTTSYKIEFVKSVSKVGYEPLNYANFSPLQLKCTHRMLNWVVVKIILCKQGNFGRIDDLNLRVMLLIKNKVKVNWPLFLCGRMVTYKNDQRKGLPYPSFVSKILRALQVFIVSSLPTTPHDESWLDASVVGKMHY